MSVLVDAGESDSSKVNRGLGQHLHRQSNIHPRQLVLGEVRRRQLLGVLQRGCSGGRAVRCLPHVAQDGELHRHIVEFHELAPLQRVHDLCEVVANIAIHTMRHVLFEVGGAFVRNIFSLH